MTKRAAGREKKIVAGGSGRPKRAAERIRESARELFYRQGIRAVGIDEIVTRAGVTKPSLYRSFPSKDELAADYLRDHGQERLRLFDAALAERPDDPRGQFRFWLKTLSKRATKSDYRGCGNSNAAVEYPDRNHPARKVATVNKRQFREKLVIEGAYASGQLFGSGGPARILVEAADALIDAHMVDCPKSVLGHD